jgi:coenzyme PQQ precursor peptide PqqA
MLERVCSLDANGGLRQIYPLILAAWHALARTAGEHEAGLLVCVFARIDHCGGFRMKDWHKPEVVEQDVGMEVTSYLPAELDA